METLPIIASEIKVKVVKLLQTVAELQTRCEQLEMEVKNLKVDLETQKNSNKSLQETNKMRNIAEILAQSKDRLELQHAVNQQIKIIDECLRLLSNK
ncbi:MAG: hypothetical protein MUE96_01465 [Bacteroidia bacterium]|jgi:hypothetical protein|nr:hypothetical protein [Bacteroidia bacterium]